jgi:UDP-N-acetyl-D-galactosamine dehydrogenase
MAEGRAPVGCIAVVGLGYVGLHLATAFGRVLPTIGFDIDASRVADLRDGIDRNNEISAPVLRARLLRFTSDPVELQEADCFIITVPTPVDRARRPDLSALMSASKTVARTMKRQHERRKAQRAPLVIVESTVFPGCTEEVCAPAIERESGLRAGDDFKVAYSPERINPGDQEHTLATVVKIVAGQDAETTETVADIYRLVVPAGVYATPDIRTAEAAKVIENIQRDLNIALMNELAIIFHRLDLDTTEVLRAARTKWNFLPFEPGLVGGHCIPVDPYYLTHRAEQAGYHPEVILAGRRINDDMGRYLAHQMIRLLIATERAVHTSEVLVLGVAFKENVSDLRNSGVLELIAELRGYGVQVVVHDPHVDPSRVGGRYAANPFDGGEAYDGVILAVPHAAYRTRPVDDFLGCVRPRGVLMDVRGILPRASIEAAGVRYWRL